MCLMNTCNEQRHATAERDDAIQAPGPSPSSSTSPPSSIPQKRPLTHNFSSSSIVTVSSPTKRPRHSPVLSSSLLADDASRGRRRSVGNNAQLELRDRSDSPAQASLLEAAVAMLSRGEETHRHTVKLARAMPGSPGPARSSPNPPTRRGSVDYDVVSRSRTESGTKKTSGTQMLQSIGFADFLQQDDRPIFIVDLEDQFNIKAQKLGILFANTALRQRPALFDQIKGLRASSQQHDGPPFEDFQAWVLSTLSGIETVTSFPFADVLWKSAVVRDRLGVITGRTEPPAPSLQHSSSEATLRAVNGAVDPVTDAGGGRRPASTGYFDVRPRHASTRLTVLNMDDSSEDSRGSPKSPLEANPTSGGDLGYSELLATPCSPSTDAGVEQNFWPAKEDPERLHSMQLSSIGEKGFFDWTRLPLAPTLPEHIQFARSVDWASTNLGSIEDWSPELRSMCNLIMASPHPSAMYWGPEHVAIYNEPYKLLAGQKHPKLMGSRYRDAWAEIWDALSEVFDAAYNSAQATMKDDDCLFMMRNGFLEETYFSWSIIPLIGGDGSVVGLYNPAFEKTRRKVAERRMLTLREIGEKTASARHVSQFWNLLLEGLAYNEFDAPLVMVYSLDSDGQEDTMPSSGSSSGAASKIAHLEGTLGIPRGHRAAPSVIDMKTSSSGFAWSFRQALTQDKPVVLRANDGTLDETLLEDIEWRGFGDPSRIVVICPIHPTTGESTLGFLVMGTNPRRPFDEDFDLFVQLLGRQLATSIASVVLFEEEIRKGERAAKLAAQDRIELSNQLVARTQEAIEAEIKFTRMAELAPVGMYIGDHEGKIIFVNAAWYDISGYPKGIPVGNDWISCVMEEDRPKALESWSTMLKQKCPVSIEFRFNTQWKDKLGNTSNRWVIASASPEFDEDGNIKTIFGSVTEISSQKFAETIQTRRMEDALALKAQQERYIDTTSHEMRNPLSAILQSADSINSSLAELKSKSGLSEAQNDLLETTIDSAQTITLCAQHQKRIVDDVLTLSKLDSAMMVVTPVPVQPVTVLQRALKMFEGEFQTADIELDFKVDETLASLGVDWVRLDPHRLSQVLINLTTNAIKFTTTQEKRTIRMFVGASKERPSQEDKWGLTFIPTRIPQEKDVTAAAEWGLGDTVYIHFAVQDTGRGLDHLEKKQLFQRFSQANPRTHVTYGGSGLGLFISRQLVELQGGEIGVASESGKGSTFAFYVKARHTEAPALGHDDEALVRGGYQIVKGSKGQNVRVTNFKRLSASPGSGTSTGNPLAKTVSAPEERLSVLVVEDNLINQKVLATQLRKIGCIVDVANHGGEAIDFIVQSRFHKDNSQNGTKVDVVLMDLEMPVMDGQTCARKLREMQLSGELVRHIPVIAVTANAREEQIKNTLKSGIDDVVSKPFRIPELLPKMRDVIARFAA